METRKHTKWLLEQVDNGLFDQYSLILNLLNFMSESDVEQFCEQYGYNAVVEESEEETEETEEEESEEE